MPPPPPGRPAEPASVVAARQLAEEARSRRPGDRPRPARRRPAVPSGTAAPASGFESRPGYSQPGSTNTAQASSGPTRVTTPA
jgi:hypothetical protein